MGEAGNTSSGSSVLDVSLVAAGITTAVAAVGAGIAVLSPAVDAEQNLRDMVSRSLPIKSVTCAPAWASSKDSRDNSYV